MGGKKKETMNRDKRQTKENERKAEKKWQMIEKVKEVNEKKTRNFWK